MRRYVLMFPGQGAQRPSMGADLAATFPCARAVFDEVDEALGRRLSRVMFGGDAFALNATETTQPALLAHSVAALRVLASEGGVCARGAVLGHSVGEFPALVATGALALAPAARLLALRGKAMASAAAADAASRGGGERALPRMVAVILAARGGGGGKNDVESEARAACAAACKATGLEVGIAALNSPAQLVLSGHAAAVDAAAADLRARGVAQRALPLAVSAPFHSTIMTPAAAALQDALDALSNTPAALREAAEAPLISGFNACATGEPDALVKALVAGVTAPVRWADAVASAVRLEREAGREPFFLEVGPGSTLASLVKTISPGVGVASVGTVDDVRNLLR